MDIIEWIIKIFFYFWLGVFGIGFVDMAIQLQNETIKTYQRGPTSPVKFTKTMTEK